MIYSSQSSTKDSNSWTNSRNIEIWLLVMLLQVIRAWSQVIQRGGAKQRPDMIWLILSYWRQSQELLEMGGAYFGYTQVLKSRICILNVYDTWYLVAPELCLKSDSLSSYISPASVSVVVKLHHTTGGLRGLGYRSVILGPWSFSFLHRNREYMKIDSENV